MITLSTGQPSTLGSYYDNCCAVFGSDSKPARFFADKIAEQGRDMEVVQAESQVMYLITTMLAITPKEK